ncbi:MAG: LysR family transcriptional regulator [Paludibacterium sp.]|uniref:LysR family transcriptional regulator n=1 Tax=Paludibacterium sp. TaxID=1917523 RepID=UPI0025D2E7F2|nr:LysR family transcriptional regulator [Paludibacterium sp.]MBV8047509.1 LysR family transcriptional regulator [Paludibacterium sp.]MBV8648692.1 LysR family transcriptional regulator [Paludibacterium sp.]
MDNVNGVRLRRLDLNALVVLHTLLQTGSVSQSAERLCLGQPAISHVLKHLRAEFGDELLYRSGRGMALTPLAQSLRQPLLDWLNEAQRLFVSHAGFDPSAAQGTLHLAMPDLLEAVLLPSVLVALYQQAPGLNLSIEAMPSRQVATALEEGHVSGALGYFPELNPRLSRLPLFNSRFIALYHPSLLDLPARLGLADLTPVPHLHTSYVGDGAGLIERCLSARGLTRRVVAHGASLLALPMLLESMAAVAVLPEAMSGYLRERHPALSQVAIDDPDLTIDIEMVWHPRLSSDPLWGFVRGVIAAEAARLFGA